MKKYNPNAQKQNTALAQKAQAYLALDLGAGSGRAIVGVLHEGRIRLEEVSRFENKMLQLNDTLYWDFLALFDHIKKAIALTVQQGYQLRGIGVDSWGVDFGLLDANGDLLANPVCYRDSRTAGLSRQVFQQITEQELYAITGIQTMEINTLFQLFSLKNTGSPLLQIADKLLFMPDLINYFLSGVKACEYTIASSSQLLNASDKKWSRTIFNKLDLPLNLFEKIIFPGELVGSLRKTIAEETNAHHARVFAVASHDTASAFASVPLCETNQAFLSSGTWSLIGIALNAPHLSENARQNSFTNEGGANNKTLFMRNITGLWLLQRLIAEWEAGGDKIVYDELLGQAEKASPFQSIVNSDDKTFNNPNSMKQAIQEYCRKTNQKIPETRAGLTRCVLESLCMKYYFVLKKMEETTASKFESLSIAGGGSKNKMLNQMIANALNIKVVSGLTEASALGNVMQQMIADKIVEDWTSAHQIIERSFSPCIFAPQDHQNWIEALRLKAHLFEL